MVWCDKYSYTILRIKHKVGSELEASLRILFFLTYKTPFSLKIFNPNTKYFSKFELSVNFFVTFPVSCIHFRTEVYISLAARFITFLFHFFSEGIDIFATSIGSFSINFDHFSLMIGRIALDIHFFCF